MKKTSLLLIALASVGLTACGATPKETTPVVNQANEGFVEEANKPISNATISNNKAVKDYLTNITYDEAKVLAWDLTGSIEAEGTSDDGNAARLLVTKKTKKSVQSGTGNIDTMQAADTLFPGQLILADDKLLSGNPTTMNLSRNKGKVYVNVPGYTGNYFSTPYVDQGNVNDGITNILNGWADSGNSLTANAQCSISQVYSKEQIDVSFGLGLAEKFNISVDYKPTSEMNTFILEYEQIFYTANISMEDADTTLFANSVTVNDIKTKIGDDGTGYCKNPPLIIQQASYGKLVYFKVETTKTLEEVEIAFGYAGSVDVEAQAAFNEEMSTSSISAFVYGGTCDPKYSSSTKLGSDKAGEINSLLLKDNTVSSTIVNGKLLSYSTRFVDHNQKFAEVVSTSDYIETEYYYINAQKAYTENDGGYNIENFWWYGYHIDSWTTDGKPVFSTTATELYHCSNLACNQSREVELPANYGKICFKYDIGWGSHPGYDGRVSSNDFFEDCDVNTGGTTLINWVTITCDGVTQTK